MEETLESNEDFFSEVEPLAVKLSHLNNKSSVLRTKNQNLTGQYLALQQLDAHQRMILRAKGVVDTSAPQSLQSYVGVTNKQKKKLWLQSSNSSKFSDYGQELPLNSKIQIPLSEEEDNGSLVGSSVSRAVQTGIPFQPISNKVGDKISWYLEALSQGELLMPPFVHSKSDSRTSNPLDPTHPKQKRIISGDILDTHVNCFVKSKKPFSPRILFNPPAKSKIKEMRNYNGPYIKKKNGSNTPDTFEIYEEEENEEEVEREITTNGFNTLSDEIETQINQTMPYRPRISRTTVQDYLTHHSKEKCESHHILNRNEEDKYLDFLSKVTEDVLRSGVYSDRAIQQAFEFHMQFYEDEELKDKLQSLLSQVLEGLKISNDDIEEKSQETLLISFNEPCTSPEKGMSSNLDLTTEFPKSENESEDLTHKKYVQEESVPES